MRTRKVLLKIVFGYLMLACLVSSALPPRALVLIQQTGESIFQAFGLCDRTARIALFGGSGYHLELTTKKQKKLLKRYRKHCSDVVYSNGVVLFGYSAPLPASSQVSRDIGSGITSPFIQTACTTESMNYAFTLESKGGLQGSYTITVPLVSVETSQRISSAQQSFQEVCINPTLSGDSEALPTSSTAGCFYAAGWHYGVASVPSPANDACHYAGMVCSGTGARPNAGFTGVGGVCLYQRPPGSAEVRS